MDNKDNFTDVKKIKIMESVLKRGCIFFIGLFIGILCHIFAIDLLFGPISMRIVPLPKVILEWWIYLAGPGIIPFIMIIGGILITLIALFQLYRGIFDAITVAAILSPKGLFFAKGLFLLLVFIGFGPVLGVSLRLAWQSIFSGQ